MNSLAINDTGHGERAKNRAFLLKGVNRFLTRIYLTAATQRIDLSR